jgi:hypothetical protein
MIRIDASHPRGRVQRKSARITVSLSAKQHDVLSRLAAKNAVSLSWITRRAIEDYIHNTSLQPQAENKKSAGGS